MTNSIIYAQKKISINFPDIPLTEEPTDEWYGNNAENYELKIVKFEAKSNSTTNLVFQISWDYYVPNKDIKYVAIDEFRYEIEDNGELLKYLNSQDNYNLTRDNLTGIFHYEISTMFLRIQNKVKKIQTTVDSAKSTEHALGFFTIHSKVAAWLGEFSQ